VQRAAKAFAQLGFGKILAGAVGLDDLRRPQLGGFPGGEALVALRAAAAPANRVARLIDAGVDDLGIQRTAEGQAGVLKTCGASRSFPAP